MPDAPILRRRSFTLSAEDLRDLPEGVPEAIRNGLGPVLDRAADLVTAELLAGRIDADQALESYRVIRIKADVMGDKPIGWSCALSRAPKSSFWLPLNDSMRPDFKPLLDSHLSQGFPVPESAANTIYSVMHTAWLELSNHQKMALAKLAARPDRD